MPGKSNDVIVLPNGTKLYKNSGTQAIEAHARSKELANIRCYIAEQPNGYKEYILVLEENVVFASQDATQVWAHVDILAFVKE